MKVGISIAGGVQSLAQIEPGALRASGLASLFVSCYEDEVRWQADDIASFLRRARRDGRWGSSARHRTHTPRLRA